MATRLDEDNLEFNPTLDEHSRMLWNEATCVALGSFKESVKLESIIEFANSFLV